MTVTNQERINAIPLTFATAQGKSFKATKMKKTILSIILILSVSASFGQTDSTTVPFVSYWSIGDSYDFQITKIKRQYRDGEKTKDDSSSYVANFTVIDSTDTSYRIKWSFKTDLIGIEFSDELAERLSKYELTEVIYTTTEVGQFVEIENWEEISKMAKEIFTDVIKYLSAKSNTDEDSLKKAMLPFLTAVSSEEGIKQSVLKELLYFHSPFGFEYSATEAVEYQDEVPNMFGGNPIKADAKLYFESVDIDNSYCVLIQEMKLNPDDTKEMLIDVFKKMGLKGKELTKAAEKAIVEITDNNRFEYWYYPGVPNKIETKRESNVIIADNGGKSIEITRIELLE